MKKMFLPFLAMIILTIAGCEQKTDYIVIEDIAYVYVEDDPPPVPQGVFSVTRDEQVLLYWLPIDDVIGDFDRYVVYRSNFPDTGYWEIGQTTGEFFIDNGLVNGHTYYYAVSSMDLDGNLSDLSYEYVFDTPRPQGSNGVMLDYNTMPQFAGWDLANANVVHYQNVDCDFFLEFVSGDSVFYFNVANINTDIQDMGYTANLDEIDYSPESGWSQNGWAEVINGHTYIFWTDDNHFAKIRVTSINSEGIIFDWAYQVDAGNLELKPVPKRSAGYLRHPESGA